MATKAIKVCAVHFFKRFLNELVATTKSMETFNARPDEQKLAIVVGRLVDQHEEMLNKWREAGVNGAISPLPVFLMAFGKDYTSSGLEKGRSVSVRNLTVCDDDGNFFRVRLDKHDQRVQIVLYCPDHETAFSFASQFKLFANRYENRHNTAFSAYNGIYYGFAMTLEDNQVYAPSSQIADQDNLTVLTFDLTFTCHTPYFLGDVENNTPYLPVVQAVVIDHSSANEQINYYHKIEGNEELVSG